MAAVAMAIPGNQLDRSHRITGNARRTSHHAADPSALIHQFQRLERDIGATLYHRSSPGHPMRPTARGNALLQALGHPAVRALAPSQRDASQPAGLDPPPC
jgi:hypothetical protein